MRFQFCHAPMLVGGQKRFRLPRRFVLFQWMWKCLLSSPRSSIYTCTTVFENHSKVSFLLQYFWVRIFAPFVFDLPKFSPVNSWLLPKHGRCIIGKMRLFGWFSNTLLQPMVARNSQVEAIRLASKIISPIAGAPVNLIWIVRNRDFVALTVVQIVASSLLRLKTWTIRPNI